MAVPDRSTLTESRTLQGSTPLHQVTLTRTWCPLTAGSRLAAPTDRGLSCPGRGMTSFGWPRPGSTGAGLTMPPTGTLGSVCPGSPGAPPPALSLGSLDGAGAEGVGPTGLEGLDGAEALLQAPRRRTASRPSTTGRKPVGLVMPRETTVDRQGFRGCGPANVAASGSATVQRAPTSVFTRGGWVVSQALISGSLARR